MFAEKMGKRKGQLLNIVPSGKRMKAEYLIPARGTALATAMSSSLILVAKASWVRFLLNIKSTRVRLLTGRAARWSPAGKAVWL